MNVKKIEKGKESKIIVELDIKESYEIFDFIKDKLEVINDKEYVENLMLELECVCDFE